MPADDETRTSTRTSTLAAHAAAWAFVFLLLRIFAVSGYDWDTAFLVSTTLGPSDGLALVFGSLMAGQLLTAVLLAGVLPLLVAGYLWGPKGHRPTVLLLGVIGVVVMAALTVSFANVWLPVATAAVLIVLAGVRLLPMHGRARRATTVILGRVSWAAGAAVLLLAALVQTPWVPEETITTTDGIVTGHVLSVDSGYLNVITDDHQFEIILTSDVLSRK